MPRRPRAWVPTGTRRSPIRNVAASIRRSMRPAIEPHIQPGDMARICRPVDWFGLNHYSPVYVKAQADSMLGFDFGEKPAGVPLTPIGWPIDPEAFGETLRTVHESYGLPIYVLENGYGNYDKPDQAGAVMDPGRIEFLRAYIGAMNAAASDGVDVRGYFIWSLLDNFEWDSGVQYPVRSKLCRLSRRFGVFRNHRLVGIAV